MSTHLVIDVTTIEPALKHPTIFKSFDSLEDGDCIMLKNDHDPKPLYYHLLDERGNCFSWNYITQGPTIWEVEIKKSFKKQSEETIGEMARKDFRKAEVFKKLGIDFCCGGKKTIAEACKATGLDIAVVQEELSKVAQIKPTSAQHDFNAWPLSFLADYIINVHHKYVTDSVELLDQLSDKVATKHSDRFPELLAIRKHVYELLEELVTHMKKEEVILFPYIKQLEQKTSAAGDYSQAFNTVQKPIWVMEQDHEVAGDLLKKIRSLTNGYTVPANACNSFNFLYKKLEEFEEDLHRHIHLENNILFPKAIQLEEAV